MSAVQDRIYLDNAATSWPKPEEVYQAIERYARQLGAAAGRGVYTEAVETDAIVSAARRAIARLVGAENERDVVFTSGGTDSLNMAIHGAVRPGDHVVTTVVEHNSVLRPLRWLEEHSDVEVTRVDCDDRGVVHPEDIERAIRPGTRLIALAHAANVTGALQPIEEVSEIARRHDALFLVDAAQSLGEIPLPIDIEHIDLLAAPGHKGLLGPLGVGVLCIRSDVHSQLRPLRQGGGGSARSSDRQPETPPEKYEAGNLNALGIAGVLAGVEWILSRGVESLREHTLSLTSRLLDGLRPIDGVTIHGPECADQRVGVVSVSLDGVDPQELALMLDSGYRIQTRAGLHCAPAMHERLGTTAAGGTLRFSIGPFNTADHIDAAIAAMTEAAASFRAAAG